MPEEKKLGPGITYTNPDKSTKIMTVAGVLLREGQSVDLVEKLGETRARPILEKLAKNRYFQVQGGPKHEKEEVEQPPVAPGSGEFTIANNAQAEYNRIRVKDGEEAADRYLDTLDDDGNVKEGSAPKSERRPKTGEPPEDVKTPDQATLERPAPRRTT